jgi:hypothetical protein
VSPDVGVDTSYRAEADGPHAAGLVEDRLDALLIGSAGPVMWDALSSELAAAVTEQIINMHHPRSNLEWAETKLRIAQDISRHVHGYCDPLLPQAAGAGCSIATQRAGIHSDTSRTSYVPVAHGSTSTGSMTSPQSGAAPYEHRPR